MHTGSSQTLDSWVSWSVCGRNMSKTENVVWLFSGLYTWPFVQGRRQRAPKVPHQNYTAPKHHWKAPAGDGLFTKLDAVPGEVLQQSGFGLMLFGIFLNFLDDGKGNVQI